jgi:putative SOS response-associated peptidase YedK
VGSLEAMLRPAPDDWLEMYPVSTRVNSPDNNDAELIQRVEPDTLL